MNDVELPRTPSPWHEGERALHERLGVGARMETLGPKLIRDRMPDQHRLFFEQLPFVVLGAVGDTGAPWATLLEGAPGFLRAPDPRTLRVGALPAHGDPARAGIEEGASIGLLGIEPSTRRRNRVNGRVAELDEAGLTLAVEQSFGNCPQYIQTRDLAFTRDPAETFEPPLERRPSLDAAARAQIAAADTFFVASYGGDHRRGVDVSHRGGKAGFVRVSGEVLTIPDFSGNLFFNTLGNLLVYPRAGLAFADFRTGDLLQLTGAVEVVLEGEEIRSFRGAERLWRVKVEEMVRRRGALALRGELGEYSPRSLATGAW